MGVEVPLFKLEMTPAFGNGFGMTETSTTFDEAIDLLANSFQAMVKLAQVEKTVELMAAEIERNRRRVNALEYVLIPQIKDQIKIHHHEAG
jgi:V/A-type H+-transporting ATPase subunit D